MEIQTLHSPQFITILASYKLTAVDCWLLDLRLGRYLNLFRMHDFEDYLALPFLSEQALYDMGIEKHDVSVLYSSIKKR